MGYNRVNPPKQVTLPPELAKNPQLRKAFDDVYQILFQLWQRTGAGSDWIDGIRSDLYEFDDVQLLVESFKENKPDVKVATLDYTTLGDQVVICNDALTVYLNDSPRDREKVKVITANGDVVINGNGKNINKKDKWTVIFKNLVTTGALDIVYVLETDEWFIV
ncbi:MAG: hypothetical protein ACPGUE_12075 [Marinomonas sp.]